jgi:hypothetical protein
VSSAFVSDAKEDGRVVAIAAVVHDRRFGSCTDARQHGRDEDPQ